MGHCFSKGHHNEGHHGGGHHGGGHHGGGHHWSEVGTINLFLCIRKNDLNDVVMKKWMENNYSILQLLWYKKNSN
jgi:hypothetical protein